MSKKTIVTIVGILSVILVLIALFSTTYALFSNDIYAPNAEVYTTGTLSIEAKSKTDIISLSGAVPLTDTEGMSSTPYVFTIKNTGNLNYKFNVQLVSTGDSAVSFLPRYIRLQIDDGDPISYEELGNEIKTDVELAAGESIDISIRIWLGKTEEGDYYNTPNSELGKIFNSKIVIDGQAVYTNNKSGNTNGNVLMIDSVTNANSYFFGSDKKRSQISSVTFLDNVDDSVGKTTYDVSIANDDSVLMWYDVNGTNNTLYDCYIGGVDGKVIIRDGTKLFAYLTNATDISFNNSVVTNGMTSLYWAFTFSSNLRNIDFSGLDTSNVTNFSTMFAGTAVEVLDLTSFDTSSATQLSSMFAQCTNLIEIKLSNWDTSNVTTMQGLFQELANDVTFDISNWDTSNVTNMRGMFDTSKQLTSLDLSNFDTSNVTDMQYMFNHCSNLTTLDLSHFDTLNVTDMSHMFNYCTSLVNINLNGWNTSNVTDMGGMFQMCSTLTSLDLSSFDTSNVTDTSYMFNGCSSLTQIDFSNANFSKVSTYDYVFSSVQSNTLIIVADSTQKNWITSRFTNLTNVKDKTTL